MKLQIVISGQSLELRVAKKTLISKVISDARNKTGNIGNNVEWEARDIGGKLLDNNTTVEAQKLMENQRVYINPMAGAGG